MARMAGLGDMHQLFYLSRAADGLRDGDVQHILARARSNNWKLGVTGCLLFSGDHFAQVLEGPSTTVQELAARIAADHRHTDFVVLQDRAIESRRYADWSMGFLYRAEFADALESILRNTAALPGQDLSWLLDGMKVDTQMGPL